MRFSFFATMSSRILLNRALPSTVVVCVAVELHPLMSSARHFWAVCCGDMFRRRFDAAVEELEHASCD